MRTPIWMLALAVVLGLPSPSASAADRGGVLFYAPMDGGVDAAYAAGDPKGVSEGTVEFVPGKRGQAFKCGEGFASVSYAVEKNLMADEGTIEFWVCPVGWETYDGVVHLFFQALGDGGIRVYKLSTAPGTAGSVNFDVAGSRDNWQSLQQWPSFKTGEWLHIVVTWNRREYMVYPNAFQNFEPPRNPAVPKALSGRFLLGDLPIGNNGKRQSLIDEVYVYDRALNKKEVDWMFAHALDRTPGEDVPEDLLPSCDVRVLPQPSANRIKVSAVLNQRRPDVDRAYRQGAFAGTAELIPAVGTKPAVLKPVEDGTGQAFIEFSDLPAGSYEVKVGLRSADGKDLGGGSGKFTCPGPAVWRGNKIGISDTPPPPYTPLGLTLNSNRGLPDIACWGRMYRLAATGFPEQIASADAELLSGPVTLAAESNGAPVPWKPTSSRTLSSSEVQVKAEGTCQSEIGTLKWLLTAEYDGMMRYDLTLDPVEDATVSLLELRIPIRKEHAQLVWHTWGNPLYMPKNQWNGPLPAGDGVVLQHSFLPYFWLGDQDRGLCTYCESDEAWHKVDVTGGFRVERKGDAVEVVWSFAREEWKLPKPWKFTFVVQATPVKDTSNGRRWRCNSYLRTEPVRPGRFVALWSDAKTHPYFGYPQPADRNTYGELVKEYHRQGIMVTPYVSLLAFSAASPEGQFYREEWCQSIVDANLSLMLVKPKPDYIDFIVWKSHEFVKEMNLDGLYHDWSGMYPLSGEGVPVTGYDMATQQYHTYERDGKSRYVWPFFAVRELYKRVYTMLKDHKKDALMIGHVSDNVYVPTLAFLDVALDGEQFTGGTENKAYPELLLPLEFYQAEFLGHHIGCRTMFLEELYWRQDRTKHSTFILGLGLLHDVVLWSEIYSQERVFQVIDRRGFIDAEFIPYWRNADIVRGQTDAVKCSVYRKPEGGALLVICNVSYQPQTVTLDVDWEKLKSPGELKVVDPLPVGWWLVDSDIPLKEGSMTLEINPVSQDPCFRLVWVR